MSVTVYVLECLILMAAFTAIVLGAMRVNPVSFVGDYPPEIQDAYYRSQGKERVRKKLGVLMIIKKTAAFVVFVFLFAWLAHLAGADAFAEGLLCAYGYMAVRVAFDTFVLDWLVFPNLRWARLPGTEHMDAAYRQKWFHVKALLPMLPVFAAGGPICAGLMVWIW